MNAKIKLIFGTFKTLGIFKQKIFWNEQTFIQQFIEKV